MVRSDWYEFYLYNPGRKVHYYATYLLDEGGFGEVWSGISSVGLRVALKVFKPSSNFLKDWESWVNEQEVCLRCLEHPHIITTFDQFCSEQGDLVIVMEKAAGSLEDAIAGGTALDPLSVCVIGTQILSALDYVHSLNIVHRDVSLKNILWFPDGVFKLSDFGISRSGVSAEELATTFVGHKTFLPPELLAAKYSTQQSDIYQLGLVLLSLLTGRYPIPLEASVQETHRMVLNGIPRQTADGLVKEHGRLAKIISMMLRRRDKYRYQTARQVWEELYDEFKQRDFLEKMVKYLEEQPPAQLPPWLTEE